MNGAPLGYRPFFLFILIVSQSIEILYLPTEKTKTPERKKKSKIKANMCRQARTMTSHPLLSRSPGITLEEDLAARNARLSCTQRTTAKERRLDEEQALLIPGKIKQHKTDTDPDATTNQLPLLLYPPLSTSHDPTTACPFPLRTGRNRDQEPTSDKIDATEPDLETGTRIPGRRRSRRERAVLPDYG